ncbi:sterol desaturase family protein [Altererythrobacter sp. ZODW24]|uniref:sterol desaturase family protein n=1 Tax=Altererythrobacter sp. ZODW24 TaxID=2185142 RepID=UPI0013B3FFAC|nr:sterol desaturase family protein [Altererythrobacter sp. ZODW24]
MTAKFEEWLSSFFGDDRRRSFGSGWISGTLSIVLGVLALCSIFAVRFPQWLTVPELRDRYPLELVRWAIDLGILASLLLAGLSMILRRRKALGITGLLLAAAALALGAGDAPLGNSAENSVYFGLDWFVLGVLSTATLFVPLERAFPLKREQGAFRKGWLTDTQYFFMSHALVQLMSVLVLLPVVNLGGMLAIAEVQQFAIMMPLPLQFIACLVIADFTQYWVHRAFHRIPLLWRFHRVHHSVRAMDWLAGSRLHLVDVIVTRGLVLLPLVLLGFDERAVFAYLGFVSVHAVFIHANFAPRLAWLEKLVVMPRFHHWHHARESKAIDKNFAVHLPWLDRLFGTKYLPEGQWPSGYGITGERAPDGYLNQLVWPFNR